jgi:hypothetical protein
VCENDDCLYSIFPRESSQEDFSGSFFN